METALSTAAPAGPGGPPATDSPMEPDRLYRDGNHLYCRRGGRYYWLAYDHFSRRYLAPWRELSRYDIESLALRPVTVRDRTPGIGVERDRSGRPVRFLIRICGQE